MTEIPSRLSDRHLIRIHPPEADVENPGKKPKDNARNGPFWSANDSTLQDWINKDGNVGVGLVDDLVVIDVDNLDRFLDLVSEHSISLPETFSVRTGGGGRHYYFKCSSWSSNTTLTEDDDEVFSIRTDGWQAVIPPSIHPETGERYEVQQDEPMANVGVDTLQELAELVNGQPTQGGSGGSSAASGGGTAPCVGSSIPSIPDQYPSRDVKVETARRWIEGNGLEDRLNRVNSNDQSGDDWLLCKCLAEAGLSVSTIYQTMEKYRSKETKWHRRDDDYCQRTVHRAIVAACDDEYVDFSKTADMDVETSERRKTDTEDLESSVNKEVSIEMSATYNDHEEVTILEGSEDGESFKKVTRTTREEDGETVEYVSIKSGRVELVETVDGEEVLAQRVTDSTSIGSPDYLGDLADALSELDEKINGE